MKAQNTWRNDLRLALLWIILMLLIAAAVISRVDTSQLLV
jgi:hypothetical protein